MIFQETTTQMFQLPTESLSSAVETVFVMGLAISTIFLIKWALDNLFPDFNKLMTRRSSSRATRTARLRRKRRTKRFKNKQSWKKYDSKDVYLAQKQGEALLGITGSKSDESDMREAEDPLAFWKSMTDE